METELVIGLTSDKLFIRFYISMPGFYSPIAGYPDVMIAANRFESDDVFQMARYMTDRYKTRPDPQISADLWHLMSYEGVRNNAAAIRAARGF
ncbi:hypothetical protein [Morganella phage Mecenats66]|nr:hypothetical protein [Morganella phage Mecenats66]